MKPKGIRVITEMAEKDVTFLTDVDALFVSLVKHAANQMPFRVIKEEKEMYECECIDCGYEVESETPCEKTTCPKCGGKMRSEIPETEDEDEEEEDEEESEKVAEEGKAPIVPFLSEGHRIYIRQSFTGKGGEGSGNFGHGGGVGGPGNPGGSTPKDQAKTAFTSFIENEGASVDLKGDPPKSGYMLSPYKDREEKISLENITDRSTLLERFKTFRDKNRDLLEKAGHYLGAWMDKGILYLDVSVNETDLEMAKRLAKKHKQIALWDITNAKEVRV